MESWKVTREAQPGGKANLNIQKKYQKIIRKISEKYQKNIRKISEKYQKNIRQMSEKCLKNMVGKQTLISIFLLWSKVFKNMGRQTLISNALSEKSHCQCLCLVKTLKAL